MQQVGIIRGLVLRKLKELRILISCLPVTETEAMSKLTGVEGVKTSARIADYVLSELGHEPPAQTPKQSPTLRLAKHMMDDGKRG